jgi:hypothetical protein
MGVMVVPAAEGVGSCFTGLQRASTVGLRPAGGHGGPLDAKLAAALFRAGRLQTSKARS